MKRLITYPAIAAAIYIAFLAILFVMQDRAIFMAQPEPVTPPAWSALVDARIQTADDETLVAWYYPAVSGCPTFLMFHGNAQRLWAEDPEFAALKETGIGFLAVAFRGYSGSTGRPSEDGFYADARATYHYLRAEEIAPEDIVVRGFSLGAAPSTLLATEEKIGALILGAPFFSAVQMAQDRLPWVPNRLLLQHDFRTDQWIEHVRAPILIGHGDADQVIPPRHSERLQALAPDNVTRVVFPGVDHNSLFYSGMYGQAIWPFLKSLYLDCEAFQSSVEVSL